MEHITSNEYAMLKRIAENNIVYVEEDKEVIRKMRKMLSLSSNEEILSKCYYNDFYSWCIANLDINTAALCTALKSIAVDYFLKKIKKIEGENNEK